MIPIHVINLECRPLRKIKMLKEFRKHNTTDFTFHTAIHGHTLDIDKMIESGEFSLKHKRLKAGEYGCYLSHLNVLKSVLESPEELHLILEDDVFFVPNFKNKLKLLLSRVENIDWDVLYIGINKHENNCDEGEYLLDKSFGIYYPKHPMWGTHAYIVRKESFKKIVPLLEPVMLPIDVMLMYMDIKRLTLTNMLVYPRISISDTQTIR